MLYICRVYAGCICCIYAAYMLAIYVVYMPHICWLYMLYICRVYAGYAHHCVSVQMIISASGDVKPFTFSHQIRTKIARTQFSVMWSILVTFTFLGRVGRASICTCYKPASQLNIYIWKMGFINTLSLCFVATFRFFPTSFLTSFLGRLVKLGNIAAETLFLLI